MKPKNIVPITELKRDAAALVERAADEQDPIIITQNGRATTVLPRAERSRMPKLGSIRRRCSNASPPTRNEPA